MDTNTTSIILKTDSRGRVQTPRQRREELVAEFERGGLPATKFAALAGVRCQTFATWVQQRRKQGAGAGAAEPAASSRKPVRFADVSLEGTSAPVAMPLRPERQEPIVRGAEEPPGNDTGITMNSVKNLHPDPNSTNSTGLMACRSPAKAVNSTSKSSLKLVPFHPDPVSGMTARRPWRKKPRHDTWKAIFRSTVVDTVVVEIIFS